MAELRTKNYWEDDPRRRNTPRVSVDSNGQPFVYTPTPADLNTPAPMPAPAPRQPNPDDAWARPVQPDTSNSFLKAVAPFLVPAMTSVGLGQVLPNFIATGSNKSPANLSDGLGEKLKAIAAAGFGAADDAANRDPANITSQLNEIFSAGAGAAENSPTWILKWLQEQAGGPVQYNGPSADEMAKSQFNPLYEALDQQAVAQEGRYNSASEKAKQAYADYVRSLQQGQAENKQMYANSGKELASNFGEAANTVRDNSQQSFNSLSDTLSRLGIQEGADTLAASNQQQLDKQLGRLGENQQAATNLNTQLGANTYAYDTSRVGNGQQAGVNRQGDLLDQYTQMMNQNDQQRLQLQGAEGQARNDYALQIQKLLADQQNAQQTGVADQFKTLMQTRQNEQQFGAQQNQNAIENMLAQSRLDLDTAKAGIGVANPFEQLQASIGQKVGVGNAQAYMSTIMNALRDNPQATSAAQLLANMSEEDLRKPYMAQLAYAFFDKALKGGQ